MKYLGAGANKVAGLRRGLGVRHHPGGLLVHRAAALRGHLPDGRRPRPGDGVPLLRPGDQRAGHHPDRPHPGPGDRRGARRRRDRLQRRHRPADAPDLPQGGEARGRGAGGDARAEAARPLWQTSLYFASMVAILVFANWGEPARSVGFWHAVHAVKWPITGVRGARARRDRWCAGSGCRWWQASRSAAAGRGRWRFSFPRQPMIAVRRRRRSVSRWSWPATKASCGDWFAATLGLRQADPAAAARRRARRRAAARPARARGAHPVRLGGRRGRRQFARRQSLRLRGRAPSCTSPP